MSKRSKSDEKRTAHALDALPFVQSHANDRRDFWSVRPTGDYSLDCGIGQVYGEALVRAMREHGKDVLNFTILDMIDHADHKLDRGLIVGLLSALATALTEQQKPRLAYSKVA